MEYFSGKSIRNILLVIVLVQFLAIAFMFCVPFGEEFGSQQCKKEVSLLFFPYDFNLINLLQSLPVVGLVALYVFWDHVRFIR
ncbi:MAG: hypothetical protein ABEI74_00445 [Candidatus Pacearchaeota archaeon]